MNRVVVLPLVLSRIMGWPASVTLTVSEAKAMERIHLGGMEALRTPDYHCAGRTVDSLVRKGLLGKHGPTELGKRVAESCARPVVFNSD